MYDYDEKTLTEALSVLREVTQKLAHGVNKTQFENEYRGQYVSPGISVRRHVEELLIAGSLEETDGVIKLKRMNVPVMT